MNSQMVLAPTDPASAVLAANGREGMVSTPSENTVPGGDRSPKDICTLVVRIHDQMPEL
ncbi:hypothetical protein DEV91_111160 [Phyllobacterium brassicacearum]|nr:hypothetical protein DEV91_111160 [Phyllobacterium brassicacearum]